MEDTKTEQPKEEAKNPGGAPTLYTKEILVKAWDYLNRYKELEDEIPTLEGLSVHMGVSRKTLYNWAEDLEKEEFLHIFELCMAKQGKILLNSGLNGKFNSTITKLMLSKHGYVEKNETDITTKGEKITSENQNLANQAIAQYLNANNGNSTNQPAGKDTAPVQVPSNGK